MEQTTKTTFNKSDYNPILFKGYKIVKKILKSSLYAGILYLAYR